MTIQNICITLKNFSLYTLPMHCLPSYLGLQKPLNSFLSLLFCFFLQCYTVYSQAFSLSIMHLRFIHVFCKYQEFILCCWLLFYQFAFPVPHFLDQDEPNARRANSGNSSLPMGNPTCTHQDVTSCHDLLQIKTHPSCALG